MKLPPLNFLSLFSGIGGLDLGLERAGMRCVGQVEIDPYCRKVLAKRFPSVPRFEDVRTVSRADFTEDIDLIAGGFPCQDISRAGSMAGIDNGARSGLWREFHRLICEIRPAFALVENVAALLDGGIGRVLGDLAEVGYDTEWSIISACALGAPHTRERVFIVAYSERDGRSEDRGQVARDRHGLFEQQGKHAAENTIGKRFRIEATGSGADFGQSHQWRFEPNVGRVANGIPAGVDRLRGLGNAVVPQVAEWIGRRIVDAREEVANVSPPAQAG